MTPNKEDYLKLIYELGRSEGKMTNKMIAEGMGVSAPSASEMIKKLLAELFIIKDRELGYYLTKSGLILVSQLYRKHRLIESFLMRELGYSIDQVHAEAEILEHSVSDFFIDRLDELLNFPKFCPHGGTIPAKDQLLVEKYQKSLANVSDLGHFKIVRVHDEKDLLNYLDQQKLQMETPIVVTQIDHFAQTISISYGDQQLTIPRAIALQIYVEA